MPSHDSLTVEYSPLLLFILRPVHESFEVMVHQDGQPRGLRRQAYAS